MKKSIFFILMVALMTMLVACSGSESEGTKVETSGQTTTDSNTSGDTSSDNSASSYKIGGAIMNLGWPWFLGTIDGMENYAEVYKSENGKTLELQFEDGKFDINTQITQLENMAQMGVDGIVIFPVDAKAIIPTMVKLSEQGIKLVVADYPQTPDSEEDIVWETFVGHDFRDMGRVAGEIAVEELKKINKDNPTLVYVSITSAGQSSIDRFEGFSEVVMKEFPNAQIINEGDANGTRNSAQTLFENVLQRNKEIDIVSGHNDDVVLGAYNAAIGAQRDGEIKFIGMAGSKEVLQFIQEGNESWIGEVLQDPIVLGEVALEALMKSLNGEELDETYPLPKPEAITPANIKDFNWQEWSWLGNQ